MTLSPTTGRLMLIGGDLVPARDGGSYETRSPSTGESLGHVPAATAADVDRAVTAARLALPAWQTRSVQERAEVLRRMAGRLRADRAELARLDALDGGNPVTAMAHDVDMAAQMLESFADWSLAMGGSTVPGTDDHLHYTVREPYGVVARIVPYNHPIMFAASKLAAPLLAGNAVILKAPDQTPLSALRMAELFRDLLPPGVLTVLTGVGRDVGPAIVGHPDIRRIAFTGSVGTGQSILETAAAAGIKHVTLELGGKNPMIVFDDADVEAAAAGAVHGMNFRWTGGQSCGSTSRLWVHRSLVDEVVDRVVAGVESIRVGDPLDPATEMGSMVSPDHKARVQGYIDTGAGEGLRAAAAAGSGSADGCYVRPTIFLDVPNSSRIAQEEIFGPVLAVSTFDDDAAVVRDANGSRYGLTASLWTRDLTRAHRLSRELEAGYVWVNTASQHFAGLPFGGVKDSGIGREEGVEELHSFTQTKAITVHLGRNGAAGSA